MQNQIIQIGKRLLITLYLYIFLCSLFIFYLLYLVFGVGDANVFETYIKGLFSISYDLFYVSIPTFILLYFLCPFLKKFLNKNKLWLLAGIVIVLFILIYAFPNENMFRLASIEVFQTNNPNIVK